MISDFTVVMAVKNDQVDLHRTIDSVRSQRGVGLQIILADAGSTDGSLDLIRKLAENDLRCEVHEMDALNEAEVRNAMLPHVRSPYVWFLNACNEIPNDSCEYLVTQAKKYDADIVAFPTRHKNWGSGPWTELESIPTPLPENRKEEWFAKIRGCFSPPVARVYKTAFLRSDPQLRFVTDNAFEGCIHNWYSTILANRVVILKDYVFHQEGASLLNPWKSMGWVYHGDILSAIYRIERFLRSDAERHRFLSTFLPVAEQSISGHIFEFSECLKKLSLT